MAASASDSRRCGEDIPDHAAFWGQSPSYLGISLNPLILSLYTSDSLDDQLQGFNAINSTELPDALDSNLTYYQVLSPVLSNEVTIIRAFSIGLEQ